MSCQNVLIFLVVAVLFTAIGLLAASLRKVDETDFGVEYNRHKKELDDAVKSGGLFAGPPGFKVCDIGDMEMVFMSPLFPSPSVFFSSSSSFLVYGSTSISRMKPASLVMDFLSSLT